jgi:hypothetical protein
MRRPTGSAELDPISLRAQTAVRALYEYLLAEKWRDGALTGPDCGIRLNYRVGRFVKSYLRWLPWRDDLYYLQGQAYWTLANLRLFERLGDARYRTIAEHCAEQMVERQRADGGWDYPNREWSGRIATAEGTWAAIGLLETTRQTGRAAFADAALRWLQFVDERIGWQQVGRGVAVNYFAGEVGAPVPNNSAFVLRLFAEAAAVSGDDCHLTRADALIAFLADAQGPTGELPYQLGAKGTRLEHFQCAQYNAFQCLDLIRYLELTRGSRARSGEDVTAVTAGVLRFLCGQVAPDGSIPYRCGTYHPQVSYHLAAVAAALNAGARADLAASGELAAAVYRRLFLLQRPDGSFPHSQRDYGVLSDRRSYPRNLAMILVHLLDVRETDTSSKSRHPAQDRDTVRGR